MAEWPEYETRKRVRATPIVRKDGGMGVPVALFVAPDGVAKRFDPTEAGMAGRVGVGDYALEYPDGFRSVNTKANFEATAVRVVGDIPVQHIWCAVRNSDVHIDRDTLHAKVTTSVHAFSTEAGARLWSRAQRDTWSIVQVMLDPPTAGD